MTLRALLTTTSALVLALVLAVPAFGTDNGEGLIGETNDRIITFFSLGALVFFFSVVCFGSFVQGRLEKRKQERKAEELRQRVGW